jgi:hypothetical protein
MNGDKQNKNKTQFILIFVGPLENPHRWGKI